MAKKRSPSEADHLLWYRLECFKRSPYFIQLKGRLKRAKNGARLEQAALLREIVRAAPLIPIESDGIRWATLKIDLSTPIPLVVASLERFLKQMHDEHKAGEWMRLLSRLGESIQVIVDGQPRSALARLAEGGWDVRSKKDRVHLTTLKAKLKVWDHVQSGTDFVGVAKKRVLPVSTVRSLYQEANWDICGGPPPKGHRARVIQDLDPQTHVLGCPTCARAKDFKGWCAKGKAYAAQDYVSLRELAADVSAWASDSGIHPDLSDLEKAIQGRARMLPVHRSAA